jgi:hypothetical protein
MAKTRIPLAELVHHITSELRDAHARAVSTGTPVMQFQECELEFAIETERSGKGGINVWIIDAGGELKRNESNTIKVKYVALPGVAPIVAPVESVEPRGEQTRRQGKKIKSREED